jgi:flavin reductase (DIM6/NTAB) family NADH-FMN oxidoreductase RutF
MTEPNKEFKDAMSLVPTSVGIVWSRLNDHEIVGCTISSFISVSILTEQEAVGFVLRRESRTANTLRQQQEYTVSILSENQSRIAEIFASGMGTADLYSSLAKEASWDKLVVCEFHLSNSDIIDVGPALLFISHVNSMNVYSDKRPLIYSSRQFLRTTTIQS